MNTNRTFLNIGILICLYLYCFSFFNGSYPIAYLISFTILILAFLDKKADRKISSWRRVLILTGIACIWLLDILSFVCGFALFFIHLFLVVISLREILKSLESDYGWAFPRLLRIHPVLYGLMVLVVYLAGIFLMIAAELNYEEEDFEFSIKDKSLYKPYKIGDTLYFAGSNNDRDTFMVSGMDSSEQRSSGMLMAPRASHDLFVRIKHLPQDRWVRRHTESGKLKENFQSIIAVHKLPQGKETNYSINYRNFYCHMDDSLGILKTDTLIVNGKIITNCYHLDNRFIDNVTEPFHITTVYWSPGEGMIAYKCKDGTYYTKE